MLGVVEPQADAPARPGTADLHELLIDLVDQVVSLARIRRQAEVGVETVDQEALFCSGDIISGGTGWGQFGRCSR
jgi:hypothetical protein